MPEYRVTVPVVVTVDVDLDPDFYSRTDRAYAEIIAGVRVQALVDALDALADVVGDSTFTVPAGAKALTREETIRDGC